MIFFYDLIDFEVIEMDNSLISWPDTIRKARKRAGLTQKQLAEKMGVTISFVSQYENGYRTPKPETLEKFSAALDIAIFDFEKDKCYWNPSKNISKYEELRLIDSFRGLNDIGKAEALKRVQELTEIDRYKFK